MSSTASSPRAETLLGDIDRRGLDHFFRSIKTVPRIPREELPRIYAKLREGDEAARERLILSSALFAAGYAYSYCRRYHIPVDDLLQEALLGLITATEKWDISRGGFLICAKHYIQRSLRLAVATYLRSANSTITIEETLRPGATDDEASTLADLLEAPDVMPRIEATMTTTVLLHNLSSRERQIIELRYGLHGDDPMVGVDVGQLFGISRQRISIIEQDALDTMRCAVTGQKRRIRPRKYRSSALAA